jgi:hypothetical protein
MCYLIDLLVFASLSRWRAILASLESLEDKSWSPTLDDLARHQQLEVIWSCGATAVTTLPRVHSQNSALGNRAEYH